MAMTLVSLALGRSQGQWPTAVVQYSDGSDPNPEDAARRKSCGRGDPGCGSWRAPSAAQSCRGTSSTDSCTCTCSSHRSEVQCTAVQVRIWKSIDNLRKSQKRLLSAHRSPRAQMLQASYMSYGWRTSHRPFWGCSVVSVLGTMEVSLRL